MSEVLMKMHVKEVSKKSICDGYLYLSSNGKKILLLKPGSLITSSFLHKHAMAGTTFEFSQVSDQKVFQHFSKLFKELKYLHFEKDLNVKSEEILHHFFQTHGNGEQFFSFAYACYEEFSAQKEIQSEKLNETDVNLFIKSFYSAGMSVLFSLSQGIYHYPMIKDIYNLSLCLDIGLCHKGYSFFVAQACNQENKSPGSGLAWIKGQSASPEEIEVFKEHPQKGYEFFTQHSILNYPELKKTILFQHEIANGMGFPNGVHHSQISSIESILILADALVEIKDGEHFPTGVLEHIKKFDSKKIEILPVKRVFNKFLMKHKEEYKFEDTGS